MIKSGLRPKARCAKAFFGGFGCTSSWWWLRSPGYNTKNAAVVNNDGNVNINGNNVNNSAGGVRPALPQPRLPETTSHVGRVCAMGQRNQIPSCRKRLENTCRRKGRREYFVFPFLGKRTDASASPVGELRGIHVRL